ncbi:uncharacterized protein [Hoplias malabaricus]|uniref:uncharacterized protein n=1 Tax=Hoplias malabaricus TaxID=27720 RepID=UPI003462BBA4
MTLSNVKLVMQHDAKEPPIFRSDSSDKFTFQEWENLMTLYLRKRSVLVHEHSHEILDRLMGKAGDVVKIKLPIFQRKYCLGCGGLQTQPDGFYDLEIQLHGTCCVIPSLVVPGQHDDIILGSNVIKHLIHDLKNDGEYWNIASRHEHHSSPNIEQFLSMFTGVERWRGSSIPSKVGTAKLTQAVTLLLKHEHLVWRRLPASVPLSPGTTIIVEPTNSKAKPRGILIGRLVTPLWGDRWVRMTVVNPSNKAVTLKRNSKLADVSPCLAAEDLMFSKDCTSAPTSNNLTPPLRIALTLKTKACLTLDLEILISVHVKRVPPAHYQKLRQVLTEMEERGIIRKSLKSEALSRLRAVFQRLRENNLKLAPKKCHLLTKVEIIAAMGVQDLMEDDGATPSVKRLKSFLGMVFYYQHFIPNCFSIAEPLFKLTAGQKRRGKLAKNKKSQGAYRKGKPSDWTAACERAFNR